MGCTPRGRVCDIPYNNEKFFVSIPDTIRGKSADIFLVWYKVAVKVIDTTARVEVPRNDHVSSLTFDYADRLVKLLVEFQQRGLVDEGSMHVVTD